MLKSYIHALIALGLSLPGAISGTIGLIAASEKVGFKETHPEQHQKLINCANTLLYVATEHWLGYILLCSLLAILWAFVVAEPKATSKRKFEERKRARLGKGR